MWYPACGKSKKVAILCEGYPPCVQRERQLSLIVLAPHPRFSDGLNVNAASPQAVHDCICDVLIQVVADTTQPSAPRDVWRASMARRFAAPSRMRHPH